VGFGHGSVDEVGDGVLWLFGFSSVLGLIGAGRVLPVRVRLRWPGRPLGPGVGAGLAALPLAPSPTSPLVSSLVPSPTLLVPFPGVVRGVGPVESPGCGAAACR
jgi:hypothetical protein